MEFDVFCVTPDATLFSQVRENSGACRRWVQTSPAHDGHAVLVGGGPSLRTRIDKIRARQQHGQKVFALNGSAKFLDANGITPDFQVLLDPQPLVKDMIGPAGEHLVASQCHPDVFAALSDPTLFHFCAEGVEEHIPEHGADYALIGGGYTVGLTAMCLAYAMGYRNLHLYGYDSSGEAAGSHAYRNGDADAPWCPSKVPVVATQGGMKFPTTFDMAKQAMQFPKLCNDLIDLGCTVTVDCDGLLSAVVREMRLQSTH